ncbi:hypothetical protein OG735_33415 [Streptomyces sp. NBC_01210]|nr:hypothetical protein OG735_33415 [Streptomyces sp. NBC_01210]
MPAGVRGLFHARRSLRLWSVDPLCHRKELQRARSLLFVAATRARDSLDIFWHGSPSQFLRPLLSA